MIFLASVSLMLVLGVGLFLSTSLSAKHLLAHLMTEKKEVPTEGMNEHEKSAPSEKEISNFPALLGNALIQKNLEFFQNFTISNDDIWKKSMETKTPLLDTKVQKMENGALFSFSFVEEGSDVLQNAAGFANETEKSMKIFQSLALKVLEKTKKRHTVQNISGVPFLTTDILFLLPSDEEIKIIEKDGNNEISAGEIFEVEKQNGENFPEKIILENMVHSFLLKEE